MAATLISSGAVAVRGFDDSGFRLATELAWRFAILVYFAAIVAGPVTRLIPSLRLQRLIPERRQLLWGFCASFGVFLASLLVSPPAFGHEGLSLGTAIFALFAAGLTMVISYAASPQLSLEERSRRTILGVGLSYFWFAYTVNGLTHLFTPFSPDAFYGVSLALMVGALLLRFADHFWRESARPR
ncbi:MAG TPA: hypothetical protein VKB67_09270 [Rhizomicrobium sp.]|nr:hypothetical protein [Rhizomicrobium sp.]